MNQLVAAFDSGEPVFARVHKDNIIIYNNLSAGVFHAADRAYKRIWWLA
jgi:hypothetical protein